MTILDELPKLFSHWKEVYSTSHGQAKVSGNLVDEQAKLPADLAYYGEIYREIYNVRKRVESQVKRTRGKLFRYYLEKYPRQLSARDIDQYINSDAEFIEIENKLHDVTFWEGQYESLVNAFDAKNWQLGHITKLYVADITDIEV